MFIVYQIVDPVAKEPIYVGYSKDIELRQQNHNKFCYNSKHKEYNKKLYIYCRENNITNIILEPIYIAKTERECKLYECYTILFYHFQGISLKQSLPKISYR